MPESAVAEPPVQPASAPAAAQPEPEFTDLSTDLDSIGTPETPSPTPPPTKPAPSPTPAPAKDGTKVTPPPTKPPEKPAAPVPAKADDKPPQKVNELRTAYETTKAEAAQLRAELAQAKAEGASKKELDEIRAQLTAAAKEKQDLADELRFANYERSPEYKTQYQEPLTKAFTNAYAAMDELTVAQEDGSERKATPEDFNALINLPLGQAVKKAKELFGDAATEALAHRTKILDLDHARKDALATWKTKASERDTQTQAQQQAAVEGTRTRFNTYLKSQSEKYKDLYAPSPTGENGASTDPEGDDLLARGSELADKAFLNHTPKPGEKPLSHQELVDLQAEMRLRAASFGRQVLRAKRAEARVKELEAKLEAYNRSEPGPGDTIDPNRPSTSRPEDWQSQADSEIEALGETR